MASNRKYAALPDLDSAPDIYETPELTDDNSTIPPTTLRSSSDNELDDEDDEDDEAAGISHSRLRVDEARSRFLPANVDARDVDFSDRVNGKRKSYRASSRRQRILDDGTEEIGDLSDEDDAENLARKLARLKREIEEAREEYGRQKAANQTTGDQAAERADEEILSLSEALEEISMATEVMASRSLPAAVIHAVDIPERTFPEGGPGSATYTVNYAPTYEQTHALAQVADFDRRLVLLEKALGIASAVVPGLDSGGLPRAVVPTLESLQKQISTLSEASTASLDSISRRVRTLTQDAENLERARRNAKAAQEALASAGAAPAAADSEDTGTSEQAAKINALYGVLPTIESLAPLLPPLLDRLRSLRDIHADAATASDTLERLEKAQADMAADIQQWREGLDKVEVAMKEGGAAMDGNMKVMEGWIKELEGRMAKLS